MKSPCCKPCFFDVSDLMFPQRLGLDLRLVPLPCPLSHPDASGRTGLPYFSVFRMNVDIMPLSYPCFPLWSCELSQPYPSQRPGSASFRGMTIPANVMGRSLSESLETLGDSQNSMVWNCSKLIRFILSSYFLPKSPKFKAAIRLAW